MCYIHFLSHDNVFYIKKTCCIWIVASLSCFLHCIRARCLLGKPKSSRLCRLPTNSSTWLVIQFVALEKPARVRPWSPYPAYVHIWTSVDQGPGRGISVPELLIDILLIDTGLREPKVSVARLWYCGTICLHYRNTVIKYHISASVILCSLVTMSFITATF